MLYRQKHQIVYAGLALVVCCGCLCDRALAQDAGKSGESTDRLLLLTNGRIIKGRPNGKFDGYIIQKPAGTLLVSSDQVRLEADSVKDAYRKQRDTMRLPTEKDHYGLAQWCLLYDLYDEARQELRDALLLKPSYAPARQMLQQLEKVLATDSSHKPKPRTENSSVPGSELEPTQPSLSGLSRTAAHEFVQRVQPILINKCGNGSCHGSNAHSEFRLSHVRIARGSQRVLVQKNLESVLRFVDPSKPDQSPLLIIPMQLGHWNQPQSRDLLTNSIRSPNKPSRGIPLELHGFSSRAVFSGKGGVRQLAILQEWVRRISEQVATNEEQSRADQSRASSLQKRSESQELLRVKKPDAFDPAAFNRATREEPTEPR